MSSSRNVSGYTESRTVRLHAVSRRASSCAKRALPANVYVTQLDYNTVSQSRDSHVIAEGCCGAHMLTPEAALQGYWTEGPAKISSSLERHMRQEFPEVKATPFPAYGTAVRRHNPQTHNEGCATAHPDNLGKPRQRVRRGTVGHPQISALWNDVCDEVRCHVYDSGTWRPHAWACNDASGQPHRHAIAFDHQLP